MVVWRSGSALVSINEVNLRRARLVLGWVTASGFHSRCRTFVSLISMCNQPPRPTQPDHPFVGRRNEYQPKGSDALRLRRGLQVRVWVAGKTVISCCTWTISERFRGVTYYMIKHYTNSRYFALLYFSYTIIISFLYVFFSANCHSYAIFLDCDMKTHFCTTRSNT